MRLAGPKLPPGRSLLRAAATGAICLSALVVCVMGLQASERNHGLSAFGELDYGPDFKHFDYVNPNAPVGGRLTMIGTAGRITFDSFNNFIIKGDAAQGLGLLYDSLMTRAWDEPDAVYGLVAHSAEVSDDGKSATFFLRPEAKFADGSQITADDVVFTLETLRKKGHPQYRLAFRDIVKVEALDPQTVRYEFKGQSLRDLPLNVATLPILPKAWYATRPFEKTSLEPPLGSGPYQIAKFRQGTFVTYKRREDYWGWGLPVNVGRYNFNELRYEYFKDRVAELEALKSGEFDLREEFTSRDWATAYDVPPVRSGQLVKTELADHLPSGTQGFFLNLRRKKFQDIRVRKALDLIFDFEWTRKNIFYGAYERTVSYFENSDMKAVGAPSAEELALLEPYQKQLPTDVFEETYTPPVSDGSGQDRRNLRAAVKLLKEAGFQSKSGRMVNNNGEQLSIEYLIFSPGFERVIAPYAKTLKRVGIDASIRRVDPAQYERRMKSFDFDIIVQRYVLRTTPGAELRNYWGSAAADLAGSFNLSGIKDPVVDALIEKVLEAKSRKELVTATRALDRVLRSGHYWVSHWYNKAHRMAFWNKFAWPEQRPKYNRGVIETWWFDADKAAKLNAN